MQLCSTSEDVSQAYETVSDWTEHFFSGNKTISVFSLERRQTANHGAFQLEILADLV